MAENRFDLELGLDFSKVTEALQQIKSQFTGTSAEFQKIANKFKDSFNTMTNAIKLYGKDSSQAQAATKSMERAMVELTKNGIDPASVGFKQLQSQIGPLASKMDKTGNTVKKSNMQWTNFALILQDLPYGFRGIQNNLPAVIGGLAGMTGPIYLIGSALIALFTAYDMGAFGATKSTNDWKKALKETNDEIRNTINYTNSEVSNLQGLVDVMLDLNTTESIRNKALAEAREAITKVDEAQGKKIKTIGDAIIAINLYSEAIQQQQMQEVIGKKIAEISIGQIEKRNKLAIETAKANKGIHPIDFFMGNTELDNLNSEIIANETLLRQLEDLRKGNTKALLLNPFSQYNAKGGGKGGKTPEQLAKEAEEALLKAQNVQVQNYIDTLDNRNKEIVKSELQLQEDIFTLSKAGFTNYESALLANSARIDDINSKYDEIEYKRNQKSINDNIQFENKLAKDLDRIDKEKLKQEQDNYNTSLSYLKQYYNNKRDFATNNKEELKNIAIQEQATLDSLFIGGAINYEDYLKLSADSTAKFIKLTDDITKNAFDNMLKIGNGLMSALGPSLDLLLEKGENIGDVLSNAFQSILKQLAKVIISAAIAVALISILFPTKLTEAGGGSKLFGGLFLQGMGFGGNLFGAGAKTTEEPKKAANGGIFGGPAYRMIGEYPGAQSNPEIVAPLDKLKNLIGGSGGGTLEARISGNDLLILMNKAQRNNNLSF